jgi:ATP-dependent protease ClpP protease subunit
MRLPLPCATFVVLVAGLLAACAADAPPPPKTPTTQTSADNSADYGAVSVDVPAPPKKKADITKSTEWPDATLESGTASISCSTDYVGTGDGTKFTDLSFFSVLDAMLPCKDTGVIRLRYRGRVAGDFTMLVERVGNMAQRMGIPQRILDIDSSGGQVEDAIRAGDIMAESRWTIWVREGAVCHSACVLLLAGGDDRVISGPVGIHRIIRIQSKASSRAELSAELHEVHDSMKAYLERNGAGVAVADFMMTVPNRSLRLLTPDELVEFGLTGRNAAQEDLDRIRLVRRCGMDFVRREDAFYSAFERQCSMVETGVDAINACGLALRPQYGFPDEKCPADSPLAALDAKPVERIEAAKADANATDGNAAKSAPKRDDTIVLDDAKAANKDANKDAAERQ